MPTWRDQLRRDFEVRLRASYGALAAERRKVVEVQRQKWKAVEDALLRLTEDVRVASLEKDASLAGKARIAIERLRVIDDEPVRTRVKVLRELRLELFPKSAFEPRGPQVPSDDQVEAWDDEFELEDLEVGRGTHLLKLDNPAAAPSTGDTLQDVLQAHVPIQPIGAFDGDALFASRAGDLQAAASARSNRKHRGASEELDRYKTEQEGRYKDELARLKKEAASELDEYKTEQEAEEAELRANVLTGKLRAAAAAGRHGDEVARLKKEAAAELARNETELQKKHKKELERERARQAAERYRFQTQMLGEHLKVSTSALHAELQRFERTRPVRKDSYRSAWWTKDDVNRMLSAEQLIVRRASATSSKTELMSAFAVGQAREWLFRATERMQVRAFAPENVKLQKTSTLTAKSEESLKQVFGDATEAVAKFKQRCQLLNERLLPDRSKLTGLAPRMVQEPTPAALEQGLSLERELAKGAREAVADRLRAAEAKIDQLASEDVTVEFLSRWSEELSDVGQRAIQTQRQAAQLKDKLEDRLSADAAQHRRAAQAAHAADEASRAARADLERAQAAALRAAKREAEASGRAAEKARREQEEAERLVPVKLKLSGLRMAHIQDKGKLGQIVEQKVANVLSISDDQVRVTRIAESGTWKAEQVQGVRFAD